MLSVLKRDMRFPWYFIITILSQSVTSEGIPTINDFVLLSFLTISSLNPEGLSCLLSALCKKASNHHANLPLEMYSFTL